MTSLTLGSAIFGGFLLAVVANALHAWLGLTVLCVLVQKGSWIVGPHFFDRLAIPFLSGGTLAGRGFLVFLIVACVVETAQKFIPFVSAGFNVLNGALKPWLTTVMIAMIAQFADPTISHWLLYPLQALAGLSVLGLHIGKHVAKWHLGAPFEPATGTAWATAELAITAAVVGLGIWALT